MFSAAKLAKTKPFASPAYKEAYKMNSSKKFVSTLSEADPCKRSFDTAQAPFLKTAAEENQQPGPSNISAKTSTEMFVMPPSKKKKLSNQTTHETSASNESANDVATTSLLGKNGRNAFFFMGKVDFCLKMHALYANINATWSVFGKLVKIFEGKNRFEQYLLLRNASGEGPVLKSYFYEYEGILGQLQAGDTLRVVGRFLSGNRFHVYKVEKTNLENADEDFSRIQNVISHVLLQKHAQETDKAILKLK